MDYPSLCELPTHKKRKCGNREVSPCTNLATKGLRAEEDGPELCVGCYWDATVEDDIPIRGLED